MTANLRYYIIPIVPRWASGEKFAEKLGIPKEEGDEIPDWQYYILNLIFRASGDFKQMCLEETKKWKETTILY
jgi:hypothetical protein